MAKTDTQTTKTNAKTTANTTTNTNNAGTATAVNKPWEAQEAYYRKLYEDAVSAFQQTNSRPGVVGPNQTQLDANNLVKQVSGSMGTGVPELRNLALSQIQGDWLNPNTNPYIKDVVTAATRPMQSVFDANKLAISDRAIAEGAYGGARQDLQQNKILDQLTRAVGDTSSSIYAQNYANERQIQQNSTGLLDKANLLALAGPTALAGAGAQQQGWDQAMLTDSLQSPWRGLAELSNILGAGGFGSSTSTSTSTGTSNSNTTSTQKGTTEAIKPTNTLASILQGAMGGATTGASLATGIGGLAAGAGLGAFAPWMLPFAALGGLAGAL